MNNNDNKDWHLVNSEERARTSPDTFHIPTMEEYEALKPNDVVKLIFELDEVSDKNPEQQAERMWVKIAQRHGSKFVGVLDNDPNVIKGLKAGDEVKFKKEHVAAIWKE